MRAIRCCARWGQRLAHESRASDVTARHSSDEFVVVLYGAQNQDDVMATAEHLRRQLSEPHALAGRAFVITPSIGIALYPHDAADADSLLRHAELAMQAAKSAGGDQVHFFESSMHAAAQLALEIERELRSAIERKELMLYYQPYIELGTGEVVGAEALLRWRHHERGMIPPLDFIPIAERTGLIAPIGSWVIRSACAQRASWNATGLPRFPISLNVSAEQFRHEQVGDQLWSALEEFGLDGADIQCEVTESCLMSDALDACRQLERMRELGVRVSIDDFGTGYSSLSALSQFPIDVLKIDRSFVAGVGDKKKLSIVSAILALAESLGLDTVAEGIETEPPALAAARARLLEGAGLPDREALAARRVRDLGQRSLAAALGQARATARPTEAPAPTRRAGGPGLPSIPGGFFLLRPPPRDTLQ